MESFTPVSAAVGRALIGLSAALLWLADGRIAGISGIRGARQRFEKRDGLAAGFPRRARRGSAALCACSRRADHCH
jgi:hypothetical protein